MAFSSINTTFTGSGNHGVQVGHNSGSMEIHVAAERPETPPQPSCFVPFRRDPDFIDRTTLLEEICEKCRAPASRVALVGLGGVGKSQLAIEHCYRTAEQSPKTWVFWIHVSNIARLEQGYREIAEHVKIRGRKDPQADVFKLVHDWLRNDKNGPWLLVLDNADDATVFLPPLGNSQKLHSQADSGSNHGNSTSGLRHHLSRYLPPSKHGSVLVTSRTRSAAMQVVEDSDIITIDAMHEAAAHALLHKKLRVKNEEDDGIIELAAALDYMPLALVQAASYIRERAPRCSVRQYLEEYRQNDTSKTSLLNQEAGHLRRDDTASNSVIITWQISFDHIRSKRQSAADLLSLMSFFDRQGIQQTLLYNYVATANERVLEQSDDNGFEDDVHTLRDYSFISITKNANTFEMHSLVQLATRTWLESHDQLDQWREHFISNLCAELPEGNYENWEKCEALFPHAKAALAQRPVDKESLEKWAQLLHNAAWYTQMRGRLGEAEHMVRISLEINSEVLGLENVTTLSNMNNLANLLHEQGKYKEAELMHRQTLAQKEKVLAAEHRDILETLNNLANALDSQGKYEEAESMYRQMLARCEKVLEPEHSLVLLGMLNLGNVIQQQGRYKEAEMIDRQTLVQLEKLLGPEHPYTLVSSSNLGFVLGFLGRYDDAEIMHRKTVAQLEKVLGLEHPHTLTSLNCLGFLLGLLGRYDEAETIYRQTLAQREKVIGPKHPDTLASSNNLGLLLCRLGKYDEAEIIQRQTLARRENVIGPEHPDTICSVHNLAVVLAVQHYHEESLTLFERAYAVSQTVFGPNHPTTKIRCRYNDEAKRRAMEEQSQSTLSTSVPDNSTRIPTNKVSKLARGLAKIGLGSFKRS